MVPDQYLQTNYFDGRLAWSLGKYRNIELDNSLFDFNFKDDFDVSSSLYPIDGGIIKAAYNSNKNNLVNLDFSNISTSWTIMTAIDIFNFDNKKVTPISKSNILDDLEINKENNSFKERIDFINNFIENNNTLDEKFNLQKYLSKFIVDITQKYLLRGKACNYKLNAKLNGYLDVSKMITKIKKRNFQLI